MVLISVVFGRGAVKPTSAAFLRVFESAAELRFFYALNCSFVLFYFIFFVAKLKLLLQEMQQSGSPISQSAAAFEGPPPYCGTGCLQFLLYAGTIWTVARSQREVS